MISSNYDDAVDVHDCAWRMNHIFLHAATSFHTLLLNTIYHNKIPHSQMHFCNLSTSGYFIA